MSDATLRNDFDACVTLYQDFIKQTGSKVKGNPNVNISEVKVQTGKRKASDTAEDRYYTQAAYAALSPSQRKDLAEKRLKRGHVKGAKDSNSPRGRRRPKQSRRPVRTLSRRLLVAPLHNSARQLNNRQRMTMTPVVRVPLKTCLRRLANLPPLVVIVQTRPLLVSRKSPSD